MGLFSLAKLFGITLRESATDGSDFTNPDADYRRLYLGEDGQLHLKDSAGTVTGIGSAHSYIGYNTVGGSTENITNRRTYAKKVTLASPGLIASIGAYINQSTDNLQSMVVVVYEDVAGTPGKMLAMNAPQTSTILLENAAGPTYAATWLHLPVGFYAAAGDYWLAVMFSSTGTMQLYYDGSGTDRYYDNADGYWVSHWGRYTPTTSTRKFSIRADFIG